MVAALWADLAEIFEGIDSAAVLIRPFDADRVVADHLGFQHLQRPAVIPLAKSIAAI